MNKRGCAKMFQVFIMCVMFLCHTSVSAQNPKVLKFRHLNIENGLPCNNVRALMQDKYGYIWIGTGYGITRYDGHSFTCPRGPKTKASCSSFCEIGDTIWIGTNDGVIFYSHRCDSVADFSKTTKDGLDITCVVTRIMPDKQGNIWISTSDQGVFCIDKKKELKHYSLPDGDKTAATLLVTSKDEVWVASNWNKNNLVKLNRKADRFEPVKVNNLTGDNIYFGGITIEEGRDGIIWFGSWAAGLLKYDTKTGNLTYGVKKDEEHLYHIHWITKNEDGKLFISSDQGLCIFDPNTSVVHFYGQDELAPYALADCYTYPILLDKEGAMWVGTYYGGLEYTHPKVTNFTNFIQSSYRNSVYGNIISNMREDAYGTLWIGSDDGGLSSYNKVTNQFRSHEPQGAKQKRNVHGMFIDGDDLYVGTYSTGLDIINVKTGAEKHYKSFPSADGRNYGVSAYSIYKCSDGKIWIGTFNRILTFDPESGMVNPEQKTSNVVVDIKEDKRGNVWFCADDDGLYRYNCEKKSWKKYDDFTSDRQKYDAKVAVNCIYEDVLGELWLGTSFGMFKYDKKNDKFVSIDLRGIYPNVNSIEGEGSDLWLATTAGLLVFSTGTNEVMREYKGGDGIDNINFTQNSICKSTDGTIYLGTTHGFTLFNPSRMRGNVVDPKVVFTGLELFGKPVLVGSDNLSDNLNTVDEVEFSYKENSIRVSFSAMSYLMPENNLYQYYLEGLEDDWNTPTHEHSATYTNLSPGTYVLHVRAANNDGIWNDDEVTLTIVITPPFYWNTPVKCIYLVLLVLVIYFIISFFLNKKEREHIEEIKEINTQKENEVHEARIKYLTISDSDNEFLKRLENTIEKNFSNPEISVDFLAAEMNVSRSGLFAKVKNLADVTPNEMIQIIRLKHAAHLLETKQYRINEICYMVGFNSPSYFTKCFTKHYGVKPAEYTKQNQTEEKEEE